MVRQLLTLTCPIAKVLAANGQENETFLKYSSIYIFCSGCSYGVYMF